MSIGLNTFKVQGVEIPGLSYTHPLLESKVGSDESERNGDAEPEGEEGKKCGEWDGGAATFSPQDKIEQEENAKHHAEKIKKYPHE